MEKFRWPLQRLLEVTRQRQRVRQAELAALNLQLDGSRQRIHQRLALMRGLLKDLGREQAPRRLSRQELFMNCLAAEKRRMDEMTQEMNRLRSAKEQKTRELLEIRKYQEMLERLRRRALESYRREQNRLEQLQSDEVGGLGHLREMRRKASLNTR